jgi:outer membrane protein assembly factor BamB
MAFFLTGNHDVVAVSAVSGTLVWKQNTGDADPDVGSGVTLAGQMVIVGDYEVTAYDRATGRLRWRFVPPSGFAPGPSLGEGADGLVFAGSSAGRAYGIDLESGRARWATVLTDNVNTLVYPPVVAGDLVVVAYVTFLAPTRGGIVALDLQTGAERWHWPLPPSSNPSIGVGAAGSPLVVDDLVVVSNRDGTIHALRCDDGAPLWSIDGLGLPAIQNSPVLELPGPKPDFRALSRWDRTLYAGSLTGYVTAYDIDTHQRRWRFLGGQNGSIGFQMTADDRTLYVPAFSGRLTAVNTADGTERWRFGDHQNRVLWPPALVGDTAYVSGLGGFSALPK